MILNVAVHEAIATHDEGGAVAPWPESRDPLLTAGDIDFSTSPAEATRSSVSSSSSVSEPSPGTKADFLSLGTTAGGT